jgi:hypothetical protein
MRMWICGLNFWNLFKLSKEKVTFSSAVYKANHPVPSNLLMVSLIQKSEVMFLFSAAWLLRLQPWTNEQYRQQSKMSPSKKFTCKEALRQVYYLSEAPSPPPDTLYTCIQLFTQGRGGGGDGAKPAKSLYK